MSRFSIAVTGVVMAGLLAGVWWSAPDLAAATRGTDAVAKMCGTVAASDRAAGELRLITGVGHALRVVVFRVDRECTIRFAGAEGSLDELARGQVVVVAYRATPEGYTAETIETSRPESEPGQR